MIRQLIGIKYPIFSGAMAWISDAELAAAVSNAGGLGIIAGGNAPADIIRSEVQKAKKLTDKPFGLNIMLRSPEADKIAEIACEEGVAVVTTGAGNPIKYIESFKQHNIKVIPVIPSVALAQRMEKAGVDALIAEGMESGGHIGKLTTMALVRQVVDAVSIPVIAAGGIACGRGMAAAYMLGAQGVQIGTRFIVAKECNAHDNYKKAVIRAKDIDTVVTGQITGHPVRVIRNKLARLMLEQEVVGKEQMDDAINAIEELGSGALQKAAISGDMDNGSVMAGQIAGLVSKEQTAQEIIDEIIQQFNMLSLPKF